MKILQEFLPFLKDQAAYHDRQLVRFPNKKQPHETIAKTFRELAEAIENLQTPPATQPGGAASTALTPSDLAGLPPELLLELNLTDSDEQDLAILNIINGAGGTMSLDKLLIALYRQTKEVHKRAKLTARLYRMAQKEILFNVPKKKGVYSTQPQPKEGAYGYCPGFLSAGHGVQLPGTPLNYVDIVKLRKITCQENTRNKHMSKVAAFHSAKQNTRNVYHDNNQCTEGNNIEKQYLRQGTAGRPRCEHCNRLAQ
jgi:hypothetical protein